VRRCEEAKFRRGMVITSPCDQRIRDLYRGGRCAALGSAGLHMRWRKAESSTNYELARAEARLSLPTLSARLKPCPCYKALGPSFSAACPTGAPVRVLVARWIGCSAVLQNRTGQRTAVIL
jgi:hypothetical protein